MAAITIVSGKSVQYDGKMMYGTGTYTIDDNYENYQKSLVDVAAGNITVATAFNNNVNMTEQYLAVDADLSDSDWNTVATHEVFTVTGLVRAKILPECTVAGVNAGGSAAICFGIAGSSSAFIASTPISQFAIGDFWLDATPAETHATYASALIDQVIGGGIDLGYEISGSAPSGGTLRFHCWWTPLSPTGAIAAGVGSALA